MSIPRRQYPSENRDKHVQRFVRASNEVVAVRKQQIRRDKEKLQDSILELKHVQSVQKKSLKDAIDSLHHDFRQQLHLLQERFIREASDLSEELKKRVRDCKREHDRSLEIRVDELSKSIVAAEVSSLNLSTLENPVKFSEQRADARIRDDKRDALTKKAEKYVRLCTDIESNASPSIERDERAFTAVASLAKTEKDESSFKTPGCTFERVGMNPRPYAVAPQPIGHRFDHTLRQPACNRTDEAETSAAEIPETGDSLATYSAILGWLNSGKPHTSMEVPAVSVPAEADLRSFASHVGAAQLSHVHHHSPRMQERRSRRVINLMQQLDDDSDDEVRHFSKPKLASKPEPQKSDNRDVSIKKRLLQLSEHIFSSSDDEEGNSSSSLRVLKPIKSDGKNVSDSFRRRVLAMYDTRA